MEIVELIKNYYQHRKIECPNIFCKDCGKLLIYEGASIKFVKCDTANKKKGDINGYGLTFLSTKTYGNTVYHLCRCRQCVEKKFPAAKDAKFIYAQKAARYTQYAYDVSDEDFKQYTAERQAITKEKMIQKYGDSEGIQRWESYRNKQSVTNTFEYKHEKYGMSLNEFNEFNKSRACTKKLCIQRHGEIEGLKIWDNYINRQRYTTSLQYFIEIYGDEGLEKYLIFDKKRLSFGGASKIADSFFNELVKYELFNNHEIYYNSHPYEYSVNGYKLDFYDKTINVVIEFYGDFWHCNPAIYKSGQYIDHFNNDRPILVDDIWEKDKVRQQNITNSLNGIFIVIWESDYKQNKNKIIQRLIQQLNEKFQ